MQSAGMGMDIADACAVLSCPFPVAGTERAAAVLLTGDAEPVIDRVYRFLVWQRTLRIALANLAASGADMDRVCIAPQAFRRTFPRGYAPIWDVAVTEPVTARRMLDIYAEHRRLLVEPVLALLDGGCADFTLLSGRAYQARYPDYEGRVEFDTDLLAPDMPSALRAARLLERRGFVLDTIRVRQLGAAPDATVEIRRVIDGHRISVGILVGGYHAYRAPVHARAEWLELAGRAVRVPRPEDLLVMLAARAERKRSFAMVNLNDAAVILAEDGAALDWAYIMAAAREARLDATLAAILSCAADLVDTDVVPEQVIDAHGARIGPASQLARAVLDADVRFGEATRMQRAQRRAWFVDVARRDLLRDHAPGPWSRTLRRAQRAVLKRQIDAGSVGPLGRRLGAMATRLRTRSGTFCEIAPHLAGGTTCVRRFGPWRGSAAGQALLATAARDIQPPAGQHRCNCMTFDLISTRGT